MNVRFRWSHYISFSNTSEISSARLNDEDLTRTLNVCIMLWFISANLPKLTSWYFQDIGDYMRKIAMAICNRSKTEFNNPGVHFYSGTSDSILPNTILPGRTEVWGARKTGYSMRGSVGVISRTRIALLQSCGVCPTFYSEDSVTFGV